MMHMTKQTKILVPLDGSELAENALDAALALPKTFDSEVTLLQAVPIPDVVIRQGNMELSIDDQRENRKDGAMKYLNSVRNRPEWSGTRTQVAVEAGNPAEAVLNYCQEHSIDKIVMTTHGRTGMSRLVFGSVAYKVFHGADTTVVPIRPRNA
jgi:nucleotide-binding universal stress UspA family protein